HPCAHAIALCTRCRSRCCRPVRDCGTGIGLTREYLRKFSGTALHCSAALRELQGGSPMNRYRWYVLAVLWLVAVLRFVDLQILAVLLEPIKQEFSFSDTQLALLGGLAFALFYGTLGL